MNPMESARGRAIVVQPDEGRSWWQPMPANGHADPKLGPAGTGFATGCGSGGGYTPAAGRSGVSRRRGAPLYPVDGAGPGRSA